MNQQAPPQHPALPSPDQDDQKLPWWWQALILSGFGIVILGYALSAIAGSNAWFDGLRNLGIGFIWAGLFIYAADRLAPLTRLKLSAWFSRHGSRALAIALVLALASATAHVVAEKLRPGGLW